MKADFSGKNIDQMMITTSIENIVLNPEEKIEIVKNIEKIEKKIEIDLKKII